MLRFVAVIVLACATDLEWSAWRDSAGRPRPAIGTLSTGSPALLLLGLAAGPDPAAMDAIPAGSTVLHVGFCGGLRRGLNAGDVVVATAVSPRVLDVEAENQLPDPVRLDQDGVDALRASLAELPDRLGQGALLTVSTFLHRAADKEAIGEAWTYVACDLEASMLAAACRERGLRYLGVRAVSDAADHTVKPAIRGAPGAASRLLRWAARPTAAAEATRAIWGGRRARATLSRAIPQALAALQD